jgi:hypothetical protein
MMTKMLGCLPGVCAPADFAAMCGDSFCVMRGDYLSCLSRASLDLPLLRRRLGQRQ